MIAVRVSFMMIMQVLCGKCDLDVTGVRSVTMMVMQMNRLLMTPNIRRQDCRADGIKALEGWDESRWGSPQNRSPYKRAP